jgi:hypothetical protein
MPIRPRQPEGRLRRLAGWAALAVVALLAFAIAPGLVIAARCAFARPQPATATSVVAADTGIAGYQRAGSATYLTLPEWFIVYSAEEYADFIRAAPPSAFPYFGSILDFWSYYGHVCDASCGAFPFDAGNHVMLVVIGSSFTVENALKGFYENTVGRMVEAISGHDTEEDLFAVRTAEEYGRFMHTTPWYDFPFGQKLTGLWRQTHWRGPHPLRKWERRLALSTEYAVKGLYGWLIRAASKGAYGDETLHTFVHVSHVPADLSGLSVERVRTLKDGSQILELQRYEAFTPAAVSLATRGVRFLDIAGNHRVLLTAIVRADGQWVGRTGRVLFTRAIATDHSRQRLAIDAEVSELAQVLKEISDHGATLEHIYDY